MATEPEDHPDVQVFDEIAQIEHLVRDSIVQSLPPGLNFPQFEVLRLLARRGDGITPGEIARELHAPKSGLTNTLQRLTEAGLARLEDDEADGRRKRVWMTLEGRRAYRQAMAVLRPKVESLRFGFTKQEFRDALPFLRALRGWLDETA